jgi:hypothetical protein
VPYTYSQSNHVLYSYLLFFSNLNFLRAWLLLPCILSTPPWLWLFLPSNIPPTHSAHTHWPILSLTSSLTKTTTMIYVGQRWSGAHGSPTIRPRSQEHSTLQLLADSRFSPDSFNQVRPYIVLDYSYNTNNSFRLVSSSNPLSCSRWNSRQNNLLALLGRTQVHTSIDTSLIPCQPLTSPHHCYKENYS